MTNAELGLFRESIVNKEVQENISENDFEFGTLSKLDVVVLASAIEIHSETLDKHSSQRRLKPLELPAIKRLVGLKNEISLKGSGEKTNGKKDTEVINRRIEALGHAFEMIDSPDFGRKLRRIQGRNPDVAYLIGYLSDICKTHAIDGNSEQRYVSPVVELFAPFKNGQNHPDRTTQRTFNETLFATTVLPAIMENTNSDSRKSLNIRPEIIGGRYFIPGKTYTRR